MYENMYQAITQIAPSDSSMCGIRKAAPRKGRGGGGNDTEI